MRKLLFAAMAVLGLTNVNAQSRDKGQIEVAPYVQYMSSFFNGDNADASNSRNAINFGVKADYFFNDRWSLRSGVSFDSMGAKDRIDEAELNYINIPVNANWHFGSTRKWNLNFGVTPGFLSSAKFNDRDIKETIESFQLGISYGIGYKLELSDNFSILFDMQGLVGLTNVNKTDAITTLNAGSGFGIGGVFNF